MWFSYLLLFGSLLSSLIGSTSTIKSLIFNPYTREVYNIRGLTEKKRKDHISYAAACPATKSKYEEDFNTKFSFEQKSLLIQIISYDQHRDVKKIECQKGFELSIVAVCPPTPNQDTYLLNLGYEVYFDRTQHQGKIKSTDYISFGALSKVIKFPVAEWSLPNVKRLWSESGEKEPAMVQEKSEGLMEQKMDLIWLPQMRIRYHVPSWSTFRSNYKLHNNADQVRMQVKCENYDLGGEMYGEKKLDDFYEPENQAKIFNEVDLPKSTPTDGNCRQKLDCVKKYNGVHPYAFQASPSSPVSCTNLTSIPIWYEVSGPLLDYLDKFLVAIAQITDNRLTVTTGISGTLKLPSRQSGDPTDIYLYPEKSKIPVPKIVFKLVRYEPLHCDSRVEKCGFEVAVVIHNEPDFDDNDKLCKEDKSEEWGWSSVQYQSTTDKDEAKKSRYIYCCEVNEKFIAKIQWGGHVYMYSGLNLKNFPQFDKYLNKNEFEDKQEEFEEVMERLFPPSGPVDWRSIPNLIFEGNPKQDDISEESENPKEQS